MESAVSILMFILSGVLLLYALLLGLLKNIDLIPYVERVKVSDPKEYAASFAKCMAVVALSIALGGVIGLFFGNGAGLIASGVAFVIALVVGSKMMTRFYTN